MSILKRIFFFPFHDTWCKILGRVKMKGRRKMKKSVLVKSIAVIIAIIMSACMLPVMTFGDETSTRGEGKLDVIVTPSKTVVKKGEEVTFKYTVKNVGEINLADIIVTDPGVAGDIVIKRIPALWTGETMEFTAKLKMTKDVKAQGVATCMVNGKSMSFKSAVKTVKIGIAVTGVTLNKKTLTLNAGQTFTLKATVKPSNATNKKVTWKSDNTKVATVSSAGKVTAKAKGTANITVTTKSGSKKATCKVTVKGGSAVFTATSSGIKNGVIDEKYGMYGSQQSNGVPTLSIPLTIKNAPSGTVCYAVFMDDPDAKPLCGYNWVHWIAANITTANIPENASIDKKADMVQGKNDFGTTGYGGPTPPDKTHTYVITVYALKSTVDLKDGFSKTQFTNAIKGKVLATATIKAKYVKK